MQVDSPGKIRNLAVVGHGDTGKTTLVSSLLYAGGVTNRLQRVEDGNAITDFDDEEIARKHSIGLAPCFVPWKNHKINLVDTPGAGLFFIEARAGIRATDVMMLCVNGVAGPEILTTKAWNFAKEIDQPLFFNLTKMDRERASFDEVVGKIQDQFSREAVPVQLPIGAEDGFEGVVDLVHNKAYRFKKDGNGKAKPEAVPDDLTERVAELRAQLVEAVAESGEALMETFFENGDLTQEQLEGGIATAVVKRRLFPITVTSALHGIGQASLLDFALTGLPSPEQRKPFPATNMGGDALEIATSPDEPLSAIVFKTLSDPYTGKISIIRAISGTLESDSTCYNARLEDSGKIGHLLALQGKQGAQIDKLVAGDIGGVAKLKLTNSGDTLCAKERPVKLDWINVRPPAISFAIEPKSKGDEDKLGDALQRMMDEDLAIRSGRDAQTGEFLLSGMGQLHVEITVAKLKSRNNVEVILHPPKVPYRETIRRSADGHGRHKKQSGGRGQFADCKITVEPTERGADFEFVDKIFGGSIPQNYRPAVEKGILEARERGYLAGFPLVDFRVTLLDGQYHDVDSSEMAFKIAGSLAYKDAMAKAGATILEPVMTVEITVHEDFMGEVMGDLSQRRGRPQGMEAGANGNQVVTASVPMSEMLDYAPALNSLTQGTATFIMEFDHYDEVPAQIQQQIIAEAKRESAAEG